MNTTVATAVLVLSATLGLAACGTNGADADTEADTEAPPALVGGENVAVAETRRLQNGPVISGSLTPEREATVRAEINSTVIQISAEIGQSVRRGQLLARLNDDAIRDQVLSARSGVRTAEEAANIARRNQERSRKLAAAGAVSESSLEQAHAATLSAEAMLADAQSRLAAAEKQFGQTEIRAPINGVVSERQANAGDNVSPGNPLFSVVDPSSLRLEAQVPVSAIAALKVGTEVPFTVDGLGDRHFMGHVTRINPAVDPATRQVRVIVALPNSAGQLVAGLFAQGRVAIEVREGVVVPTSAIDRRGIRPTVTRLVRGVAEHVEVETGIEDPAIDRIEITQGLAAGDTVIIGAARGVQPGTRIRVAEPAERTRTSN